MVNLRTIIGLQTYTIKDMELSVIKCLILISKLKNKVALWFQLNNNLVELTWIWFQALSILSRIGGSQVRKVQDVAFNGARVSTIFVSFLGIHISYKVSRLFVVIRFHVRTFTSSTYKTSLSVFKGLYSSLGVSTVEIEISRLVEINFLKLLRKAF